MAKNTKELIYDIEHLYPIDCQYKETNDIGEKLLIKAIRQVGWRKLSKPFLIRYAMLCRNENLKQSSIIKNKTLI